MKKSNFILLGVMGLSILSACNVEVDKRPKEKEVERSTERTETTTTPDTDRR